MNLREKFFTSGIHLVLSAVVAGGAGFLVFGVWYPYPYREISGGWHLFLVLVAVDLGVGPLITLIIFSRNKTRRELFFDFCVIGIVQVAALGYGLWAVYVNRPVYLVFEYSQMTVLHATDVDSKTLDQLPSNLKALPKVGPSLVALRQFNSPDEQFDATIKALSGAPLAARVDLWQPYNAATKRILAEARAVSDLYARFPDQKGVIDAAVATTGLNVSALLYLPLLDRTVAWSILLDANTASPVGYLAIDSF